MKKRTLRFIASIMVGVMVVSGCGTKKTEEPVDASKKVVRVAYWGAVEEKEIITQTINNWQKDHPSIKVILEHIPSSYTDKVLTEIAGGNPPDIIFCDVDIFVTFFYKDSLLDLTPFLKDNTDFNIKNFFPEVVARFTRNGKIFCIPRDTAPFGVVYYNKTIFDKYKVAYPKDDWNMKEFLKTAQLLTFDEAGKRPIDEGFNPKKVKQYGFWGWSVHNFIYSFGGRFVDNVDNPTKCVINEKAAVDGMQFFIDLAYKYNVSPVPGALANMGMSINQLFSMERLAMFQSGIWETPNLLRLIGDRFEWDITIAPKGPNGKRGYGTGGSGYAILNTTKNPQEAWEVVKCLAGDYGQIMLADSGLAQPANRIISEGEHWAGSAATPQNKESLNEAVHYVVYAPFHVKWRELWDRFVYPEMDLALNQRKSVQDAFDTVVEKVNPLLSAEKK